MDITLYALCVFASPIWKVVVHHKYTVSGRKFHEEFKSDEKSMIGAKGGDIYILKVFNFFNFFKTIFSVITCYHFTPSNFKCHFWIPHDILLQKMYTFMGVALILVTMCWNKLGRCHIFKILPRNAKGGEFKTCGHK